MTLAAAVFECSTYLVYLYSENLVKQGSVDSPMLQEGTAMEGTGNIQHYRRL